MSTENDYDGRYLVNESLPKIQVEKYQRASVQNRGWVRIYGNKEEPLIIISEKEWQKFERDRSISLIQYGFSSLFWGVWYSSISPFWKIFPYGSLGCKSPTTDQLKYWFSHTSMALQLKRSHLCLSSYQNMKTL